MSNHIIAETTKKLVEEKICNEIIKETTKQVVEEMNQQASKTVLINLFKDTKKKTSEDKCINHPYFKGPEYIALDFCWRITNIDSPLLDNVLYLAKDRYTRYLRDLDFTKSRIIERLIHKFLYLDMSKTERFYHMRAIDYALLTRNNTTIKKK